MENTKAWTDHRDSMQSHWKKLRDLRLGKMEAWYESDFKDLYDPSLTMLYPFSGPDFINAHALYPRAKRYVFFALEDIDVLPSLSSMSEAQMGQALRGIDWALRDIYSKGYFITMHMGSDLNRKRAEGVVPIFMIFLAHSGHELVSLDRVELSPEGAVSVVDVFTQRRVRGLRVQFRDRGSDDLQELLYFDVDMENDELEQAPQFSKFIRSLGPTNTFVKAASYLMCCRSFSQTRELVLHASQTIFQDDTGIPYRKFDATQWDIQLFGEYAWPIAQFGTYTHQPRLKAYYESMDPSKIKHLPFPMGYHYNRPQRQNHMMVTKKSTQ